MCPNGDNRGNNATRYIPRDTQGAMGNASPENFYLELNKFMRGTKGEFDIKETLGGYERSSWGLDVRKIQQRHKSSICSFLQSKNMHSDEMVLSPSWRLVVGLGGASVYETSITLHHIYGFPYIPAQGVKGAIRNYIIEELYDSREENALRDKEFVKVFGTQEKEGSVYFFDAYPVEPPKLKVDVMNPHYSKYYQDSRGTIPPADFYNPIPIFFLTIEETPFRFIFGSKEGIQQLRIKGKSLKELIERALKEHGIGAKTAVGYGYMK